ncbi:MAG: hypothetical protein K9K75_06440, partial [Deltaproteobacteria bacterium]|nr:hypothetical protein [Deltaproteobacteria bacterium]
MRKFTISGISGTIVVATLSLFFFFSDAVPQAVAEEVVVADRIIAVVNDDVITLSELENAFMPYEKMIKET